MQPPQHRATTVKEPAPRAKGSNTFKVTAYIAQSLVDLIDADAKRLHTDRSTIIRVLVKKHYTSNDDLAELAKIGLELL